MTEVGRPQALAITRIGRRDPVRVFIHGFGANAGTFQGLLPFLHGTGSTVLVDLPGHGRSTVPLNFLRPVDMAEIVAERLADLALRPFHLIGHSLGALVACHVALKLPEWVSKLSLISCAGVGPDLNLDFFRAFISSTTHEELTRQLAIAYAKPPEDLLKVARTIFLWLERPGVRSNLQKIVEAAPSFSCPLEQVAARAIETVALWGANDAIALIGNTRYLPDCIPLTVLDGVGHLPHIEASSRVADWLLE